MVYFIFDLLVTSIMVSRRIQSKLPVKLPHCACRWREYSLLTLERVFHSMYWVSTGTGRTGKSRENKLEGIQGVSLSGVATFSLLFIFHPIYKNRHDSEQNM